MRPPVEGEDQTLIALEPVIHRAARRFKVWGMTEDDLLQEGRIAALKAIRAYDPERCSVMEAWVYTCVRLHMCDLYGDAHKPKAQFYYNLLSLDVKLKSQWESDDFGVDLVLGDEPDPETAYIRKEVLSRVREICEEARPDGGDVLFELMTNCCEWEDLERRTSKTGKQLQNWKWRTIQMLRKSAELAELLDMEGVDDDCGGVRESGGGCLAGSVAGEGEPVSAAEDPSGMAGQSEYWAVAA